MQAWAPYCSICNTSSVETDWSLAHLIIGEYTNNLHLGPEYIYDIVVPVLPADVSSSIVSLLGLDLQIGSFDS